MGQLEVPRSASEQPGSQPAWRPQSRKWKSLPLLIGLGAVIAVASVTGTVFYVPTILHPSVVVSGSIDMGTATDSPIRITFTDVGDIANTVTALVSSSGYSVTVPNGHSYNIRLDYSYPSQYNCYSNSYPNPENCGGCALQYSDYYTGYARYSCPETLSGSCLGGPLKVEVRSDSMNFDLRCS
jgi:hypothetical protein